MKGKSGHYNLAFHNTEPPSVFVVSSGVDGLTKSPVFPFHQNGDLKTVPAEPPPAYDTNEKGDNETERDQWNNQLEFLLSCISMSVGLGNVWRFPLIAYQNGGGAFLIPYLIVLFVIGKPLYFMELALGQFSSYGAVKVWKCVPFFKGIGFGQTVSTFYVATYYNALMATCIFYLCMCFQENLPWNSCDSPDWDNETCIERVCKNTTNTTCSNDTNRFPAAQLYYERSVMKMSKSIEETGPPEWRLALTLLFCWTAVFLILIRGVKSSGKTTYFTAIFPYIILTALLILGCTLDGAVDGIIYFVKPEWEKLLTGTVWFKACEQSFFSLAVGFGNLTMFSSYNRFRHNVYRDAMIVSILDTFTSLLAGFTIFAILGNMAANTGKPVSEVVDSGAGLAFMIYPQALSSIPVQQLWAVLFFLMLFTLGIGSSVSQVGNVLTVICDELPHIPKWRVGLVISVVCYAIGLLYITPGGGYIQGMVDSYGAGFTIFIFAFFEAIAVMWIYGLRRFIKDIEFMLDRSIGYYWKICWFLVVPLGLAFIFVYSLTEWNPPEVGAGVLERTDWPYYVGGAMTALAVGQVPIWAAVAVYQQKGTTLLEKLQGSFRPAADWGPRRNQDRREWILATNQ